MKLQALRLAFTTVAMALLAACAAQPARKPAPASVAIAAPASPTPVAIPLPPASPAPDMWTRLRADFVLDDCGNPRALAWARRMTRNPQQFAAQLQEALPLMAWVQAAIERARVPGEFVLLPLLESSYNPAEPGRHGDPAGMWQIMPQTARTLGLTVDREYDGRLDPAASTQAVLAMLKEYGSELHDWRLVDMAFNAGEYKISGLLGDRDAESINVPNLRVGSTTQNHLAKLMALACVVRDPQRFEVELPSAQGAAHLTLVQLPHAVELASAARAADLSLTQLRALNPGYRGARMPTDAPHHLLLPQDNAQRLSAVLDSQGAAALALAQPRSASKHAPSAEIPTELASAGKHHGVSRHRVAQGESLWSIARRYKIDPANLRAWNALASDSLRTGQSLLLSAPN
ncbi:MAG TPA: transglycosylase SLT domain-containing protein [Rhodanobacteraceae bacterium]|nr:transglycosylase SLT domain-containing protein [Rhodanobacteraceae bacterium]